MGGATLAGATTRARTAVWTAPMWRATSIEPGEGRVGHPVIVTIGCRRCSDQRHFLETCGGWKWWNLLVDLHYLDFIRIGVFSGAADDATTIDLEAFIFDVAANAAA